jgi:sporulation protein YhbH
MVQRIEQDLHRFRQIVRGVVKRELKNYITTGELIGKKGKDLVSVPIHQIEIPNFRYETRKMGGVGQGEGEKGTPIGQAPGEEGSGQAGDAPGRHILEVDVSLEELADILGEELELPKIERKNKHSILSDKERYTTISRTGPESLRHFKRTYREALKRQIASGSYDPNNPVVIPFKEDRRYRSFRITKQPETNAIIIYLMDVSGSMGDEQKEIVRIESFWIDTWLRRQYEGLETRYIIHDAAAKEVDQDTFFHTRESGGTRISSAYELCRRILEEEVNPADWNIYIFHFSDGDNWGGGDTDLCLELLRNQLLPATNLFCYGQVASPYGSGAFINDLAKAFPDEEDLVLSEINSREEIYRSIKDFLGKGK